ncbi:MAG: single-strand selective monofunctional uracil-DNA glycosylase, partial [bacterium]|nr:single-strand selective monofunctional uracil-DNA glycosylase [bacterium]
MTLQRIARDLVADIRALRFAAPVTHVYNPLDYARRPHEAYLQRYGRGRAEAVLVGMNPGPWGMVQTGVPFGEVSHVRDWLKISDPVGRPPDEHPKRPVLGWDCPRSEVSGARLWGWARVTFGQPARFFERFFVTNYCPLAFLEVTGRNRTPDKLPAAEREPLLAACDRALRRTVEQLQPRLVIGVGTFAETRARAALAGLDVTIGRILHPSPASPRAIQGWAKIVRAELAGLGVQVPA